MIRPAIATPIEQLLKEHGPMTTRQIANRLDCTADGAGYAMRHARSRFYVSAWTETGQQIWSAGKGENAPRPAAKPKVSVSGGRRSRIKDEVRLASNYVKGERIQWGGLCL